MMHSLLVTLADFNQLLEAFRKKVSIDSRVNIFEKNRPLTSNDLKVVADPEQVTKHHLINPILKEVGATIEDPEVHVSLDSCGRKVDYSIKLTNGKMMLLEAKAFNAKLDDGAPDCATSQIHNVFERSSVYKTYDGGIATDGKRWIFINKDNEIYEDLDLSEDWDHFFELMSNKHKSPPAIKETDITDHFYQWYMSILFGGKYRDNEGKIKEISDKDSLINAIPAITVPRYRDRQHLAQMLVNRLIFIKFLQSKGIIPTDILGFIASSDPSLMNLLLHQLFFEVMSTPDRSSVHEAFKEIPYLNGSLFTETTVEQRYGPYSFRPEILQNVIHFLDSFKFIHKESETNEKILDPEILGYIFEMTMISEDRKKTGSFYTPKEITSYMSARTIQQIVLKKANEIWKKDGNPGSIPNMDALYELDSLTLGKIFNEVLMNIKICDNACGSGAFLLSAANELLDIFKKVHEGTNIKISEAGMKRHILNNSIFGVDYNRDAVEIAKLRLWLWLVDSFNSDYYELLPNVDYNIRHGNSLVGYVNIDKFDKMKIVDIESWGSLDEETNSLGNLIIEINKAKKEFRGKHGPERREIKTKIDNLSEKIQTRLTEMLYREMPDINKKHYFEDVMPFHWGFEFNDVFKDGGFDLIIGNPPYVEFKKLNSLDKEIYSKLYVSTRGKYDIYVAFIESSYHLLNKEGLLAYINPTMFMKRDYGYELRKFIRSHYGIESIIDFVDRQIFRTATNYTGIFIFSKNDNASPFSYYRAEADLNDNRLEMIVDNPSFFSSIEIDPKNISDKPWNFTKEEDGALMDKISIDSSSLHDVSASISVGIQSGKDKVFFVKQPEIEQYALEPGILKRICKGKDVKKYRINWSGTFIIYPYFNDVLIQERELKEKYPNVYKYLVEKRDDLRGRDYFDQSGKAWYELWCQRSDKKFEVPMKITTGEINASNSFALDLDMYYGNTKTYSIILRDDSSDNYYYVLGLLNSKVLNYYYKKITVPKAGGSLAYKTQFLEDLPIRYCNDPEIKKQIIQLSKELCSNYTEECNTKLNAIIYKLYSLDDKEIQTIEKES